ncbi:putative copper amine oxidase [Cucurbitaria berberidis CBS 394.84]|uniref:Amine oxidase n=1 Tax=Cucurbitaria berberidis CBS 394.84 TaxID=1168544 RepID=A0A9P4GE32_9PLEO|nr:putative copper amine oxidase [Cucurbitaria berberidis CBS 394.84]KAF1843687.1 putative copper amine oxidase [Cucurbitaria berberidis CBS 394.84]
MATNKSASVKAHPFLTLQPQEVFATAEIIRKVHSEKTVIFRIVAIKEPNRAEAVKYLEAERKKLPLPTVPRRTYVTYQFQGQVDAWEDIVDLDTGSVVESKKLPPGVHPAASQDDMRDVQELVMTDELVLKEIERLKLPAGSKVVPEAWPYGKESRDVDVKQYQIWFFLGSLDEKNLAHPSSNHFAHPLDFSAVVDDLTRKVIRIDRLPMGVGLNSYSTNDEPYQPQTDAEYATELQPSIRKDLKPIHISQPEGVSFTVENDQVINWQKWRFHLDFNWREGTVLRDVTYDGRPVFYRLSLAEMTVPYADPRPPFHRKCAYDLGEGGAGNTANNLALGCDCLGAIRYFTRWVSDAQGRPEVRENCICMHEVDAGIGWKHTNYRNGRAEVTRNRELVIQTIMTISNYEYILIWTLDTAAAIHYEIRATGIMSVVPMRQGVEHDLDYGIMVAPGVMAPSHQHIFSLRLDPAIDGYDDSVIQYEDSVRRPFEPKTNPFGVAYGIEVNPVKHSSFIDLDASRNRIVKFVNDKKTNKVTGKPPGYGIHVPVTQLQLSHPSSTNHRRAGFSDHHYYFTKQSENELYPSGDYPWQSFGGDGVRQWAQRDVELGNAGVAWCNFGFTHNPRPEDWPVMPCEVFRVAIKPSNFFTQNPALDMPASTQVVNKSTLVTGDDQSECCSRSNGVAS